MFTVFDLETTGFSGSTDDVVQFSYVRFDNMNQAYEAGCLYFFYDGMSWSDSAYDVHGLSQEFLSQYKDDFKKNCLKMWTILSGANVVGHNAKSFDCPFAKAWLARMGLMNLTFGIINDTMRAFKPVTHRDKVKLTKLAEMNNLTPEVINSAANMWFDSEESLSAHNATYDTTATAMLALIALSKGYMTFEPAGVAALVEADTSLFDDIPITDVDFVLVDPDGMERIYTFNGHHDGNSVEFPTKLSYVSHNRYESGAYCLKVDGKEDVLYIDMLGTQLVSGKDFDVLDYTKKLVKGGS